MSPCSSLVMAHYTGHSLGGAISVLCMADLMSLGHNVQRVMTFGQPRVGNDQVRHRYDVRHPDHHIDVVRFKAVGNTTQIPTSLFPFPKFASFVTTLAESLEFPLFRLVHNRDPVPHLPLMSKCQVQGVQGKTELGQTESTRA